MKILVVTHSLGFTGAAGSLRAAIRHWSTTLGWEVHMLADEALERSAQDMTQHANTKFVRSVNPLDGYAFVLINTLIDAPWIDVFRGGLPIVLWVHEGASVVRNWQEPPGHLIRLLSIPRRIIFQVPWQHEVVYQSFLHHLPAGRCVCVPCGVEITGTPPAGIEESPASGFQIVSVGSVYARKRPLDLARAVCSLSKRLPIHCRFIGDLTHSNSLGPDFLEFESEKTDCLSWMGGVPDDELLLHVANSQIACFPSGDETFGMAAMECALLAKAVVLADLPCYRQIGWEDGANCLTYPVGNVAALEDRLDLLCHDEELRVRLGLAARALARTYSMQRFLDAITLAVTAP